MRVLGLVGMLLALLIVGLLVKKQLGASLPAVPAGPAAASSALAPLPSTSNPRQAQEQFKQSLDAAMQAPRPMPDEAK